MQCAIVQNTVGSQAAARYTMQCAIVQNTVGSQAAARYTVCSVP